jgi:hypothetical protein
VRTCVHRGEQSYVYEYLRLYYFSKKRNRGGSVEIFIITCRGGSRPRKIN